MEKQSTLLKFLTKRRRTEKDDSEVAQSIILSSQTTSTAVSVELEEDADLEIKTPSDLSTIDGPATQPKHGSFPPTTLAGKPRCFSVRWYGLFPWLHLKRCCLFRGFRYVGIGKTKRHGTEATVWSYFQMISHYDPEIKRRLDDLPGNGKLTSPDIQNEILQIAAALLIRKTKTELHDETDTFYAMLADECKDVSNESLWQYVSDTCTKV
ncbi:hypothetical protein KUCAC02_007094 [Chaenocephalus aceratus]|nr:hypothetical protein KUCAC02_007094 [Chaenocephalus aceratus]